MIRRKITTLFILTCSILTFSFAQEKEISLTLEDCIIKAMENNLDIAVEVLSPELSDISIALAKEKFIPQLSMSFNRRDTSQASFSFLDAAEQVNSLNNSYSVDLSQQIPTGGSFSISLDSYMNDSNRSFQSINPRYGSTLTFNFTQPLLRNFGPKMSRRDIIIAQTNLEISEKDYTKILQDTVYSVESAYWNLVYSIENLKVRQQSLKLAEDLLEKNKGAVEVGTMAEIEVLNAEASVATRKADILAAEAQVKNNEDILKTVINLEAVDKDAAFASIIPLDKPAYEKVEVSLDEALATAMEHRPDLEATRLSLKNNEINLSYAKNQLLPGLDLTAQYWSPGVSGDQILYLNDNAFTGIVVGTIPGGVSDSLKDAFNFKYKNWSIGLTLTIPINTILSRAAYAQARVNMDQAKLRMKSTEQKVYRDIKIAVRAVETNYERIQAYEAARILAERQLEAEEEKFKVGISTNYFVLQYQTALADAQINELNAIVAYNLSIALLNRDLGINLKEKNISIAKKN
jgi:outer membrane protein TolC